MAHAAWPDFADVLADALTAAGFRSGTVLPASLGPDPGQTNAFVLVEVLGGPQGALEARPQVDFSYVAPSYAAMSLLARSVDAWLTTPGGKRLVHTKTGAVTVLDDAELQAWREVPWEGSRMRQAMSTGTLTFRRGTGLATGYDADPNAEGYFTGGGDLILDPSNDGYFKDA